MTKMTRAARLALLGTLVAGMAACGGGGGGSAPPPPPPPPPPPASVQSFTPADASAAVDVQSTLAIAFDKSLDPASVTRAHVKLVAQGVPVATKVTYDDATHSVRIDPMGLDYGRTYTLSVSGLMDANGQAVASRQAKFSTWVNGETSGVYLRFTTATSTTVYQAQIDTVDTSGAPTGFYLSNNAGPDGLWNTPDDVIFGGYFVDTYTTDGQLATDTGYGAGTDQLWHTADDDPTPGKIRTFLPNGALATDDSINVTAPNSSDFHREVFTTYVYAADGTLKATLSAIDKGADGVWGTADDIIGWSVNYTYDEFGRVVLEQDTYDKGPDGLWGTADDLTYAHVKHVYLTSGRLDHLDYYDMGFEPPYSTTDNVLEDTDTYTYDGANNNVKIVYGDAATGGGLYTLITYDAHNNRQTRKYYNDTGADGLWNTADDRLARWLTYDTTR